MNRLAAIVAAALLASAPALASKDHAHAAGSAAKPAEAAMSEGEIRKVDKAAGKLTIKHGPLANLDMPAMTMVFRVKDPGMLDQVNVGDAIRFKAEKVGGNYTVTELQAKK